MISLLSGAFGDRVVNLFALPPTLLGAYILVEFIILLACFHTVSRTRKNVEVITVCILGVVAAFLLALISDGRIIQYEYLNPDNAVTIDTLVFPLFYNEGFRNALNDAMSDSTIMRQLINQNYRTQVLATIIVHFTLFCTVTACLGYIMSYGTKHLLKTTTQNGVDIVETFRAWFSKGN